MALPKPCRMPAGTEWSDFVETLQDWLAEPKAATVTLNGADRTLPEARPEGLTATGVFAPPLDRTSGYTVACWRRTASTADALTGPLNGVYSAVTLEWDHMADSAEGGVVPPGQADRPAGRLRPTPARIWL